ncbi:MAG: SGNH/GDSL hydrolase family protein, partial [Rhodospirillales bacterium]|nr:SGNH/GDSL hydrolase family protein [Rhodospirillales bacterium]
PPGPLPPNGTASVLVPLPAQASHVRLVFGNGGAAPYRVRALWAPTARVGNGWLPSRWDGSIDLTAFRPVRFAARGADLEPDRTPRGGPAEAMVPPTTFGFHSDWMPTGGLLSRTDADGTERLILVRAEVTEGQGWGLPTVNPGLTEDPPDVGGPSALFAAPAPLTRVAEMGFVPASSHPVQAVQCWSAAGGYTLLYCGSSIVAGASTPHDRGAFARIAARRLTETGVPCAALYNHPTGAPVMRLIAAGAERAIPLYRPDFTLIQVATRADPHTAAAQDLTWAAAQRMAALTLAAGGVPIYVTISPWPIRDTPDAAAEAIRQINNERARRSGLPLLDYDRLMSNADHPPRLWPLFNASGDGAHPDIAGHRAAAAALLPLLRSLMVG